MDALHSHNISRCLCLCMSMMLSPIVNGQSLLPTTTTTTTTVTIITITSIEKCNDVSKCIK